MKFGSHFSLQEESMNSIPWPARKNVRMILNGIIAFLILLVPVICPCLLVISTPMGGKEGREEETTKIKNGLPYADPAGHLPTFLCWVAVG